MGRVKAAMEDQRAEEREMFEFALQTLRDAENIIDVCRARLEAAQAMINDAIAELEG